MPPSNSLPSPRVLFITYNISPRLGAQSIQVSRQIFHYKGRCSIVYGDNTSVDGKSLVAYRDLSSRLDNITIRPIFKYKSLLSRAALKLFPIIGMLPDPYLFWSIRAFLRITLELLIKKQFRPDCIVVFGNPMSVVLAGVLISRIFSIPVISSLSDPWPWVRNDYNKTNIKFVKAVNSFLETFVFRFSTFIVTNNNQARALYSSFFPGSNIKTIPHCYDSSLYVHRTQSKSSISENTKIIRIIGSFYGPRTLDVIYPAFSRYCFANSIDASGIKFAVELYGSYDETFISESLHKSGLHNLIALKGSVSYIDSLSLMSTADVLLSIDGFVDNNVFLPSKIVDYLGAGPLIVAVTPSGSPTSDLLLNSSHLSLDSINISSLFDVLPSALEKYSDDNSQAERFRQYDASLISEKIRALVTTASLIPTSVRNDEF